MRFFMIHAFSTALYASAAAQYIPFESKDTTLPAATCQLIDKEDHALVISQPQVIKKALEERKVPGKVIEKVCQHFSSFAGQSLYPSELAQQIFRLAFCVQDEPAKQLSASDRQKYLYLVIDSFCDDNLEAAKSLSAYYLRHSQEFFRSPLN